MTQTHEEKLQYYRDYRKLHAEEIAYKAYLDWEKNRVQILAKHRKGTVRGVRKWQDTPRIVNALVYAMDKIQSINYRPSPRWAFYRVLEKGLLTKNEDLGMFQYWIEEARKDFWVDPKGRQWTPRTFADTVRTPYFVGHGNSEINITLNTIEEQENYVQCWFEARAMYEQFLKYTSDYRVSLVPFGGDCSIEVKGMLAEYLDDIHKEYPDKPIKILYFGDCDKHGKKIGFSALADTKGRGIATWCKSWKFVEFIPCGLTQEQAEHYKVEKNPDKLDQYQWESLSDKDAGEIIVKALKKVMKPVSQSILDREKELETALEEYYKTL